MKVVETKPGMSEEAARRLWNQIVAFAGYGFNKSHAAAYSLLSYQSMWIKVHYPQAFYAAAMTMLGEQKLPALLRDAKESGITVAFPDINKSSTRFEIIKGANEIVMPFQRIKGVSMNTASAILEARASGRFTSMADFESRVEKRKCNARVRDALDRVGAFASVEPMQVSANDPSRLRDQMELLPGLVSADVVISRPMNRDKVTREAISALVDDYRARFGPNGSDEAGMPVRPHFGRSAKVMIVVDAPSGGDEGVGTFGLSNSAEAVLKAMQEAEMGIQDVYWTSLIKRPKSGRQVAAEEIAQFKPIFERELEILKPPVIVPLGTQAVRYFLPTQKGRVSEMAGEVIYMKELDANVVIGFNPGEIWHEPDKQSKLDAVFIKVRELLDQ